MSLKDVSPWTIEDEMTRIVAHSRSVEGASEHLRLRVPEAKSGLRYRQADVDEFEREDLLRLLAYIAKRHGQEWSEVLGADLVPVPSPV